MKTKLLIVIGLLITAIAIISLSLMNEFRYTENLNECWYQDSDDKIKPCIIETGGWPITFSPWPEQNCDEICKENKDHDYPFGPTGPMMNQETCNDFVISQWQPRIEDREMVQQILEICIQREFLTPELVERGKIADNFTFGQIQSALTTAGGDIEKTIKILEDLYKENEN